MSGIRQTDDDKSGTNYDQNLEKLNGLNLQEENEVSEQDKCTPTLDYLQVPTINGDILWLDINYYYYFIFLSYFIVFSLLLRNCIHLIKIH
jgi:hypothetical protein